MPDIRALAYVRVRATDLDAWRSFAFETIGFARGSGPEADAIYLRMDERMGRLVILPGDADRVDAVGWEVAGPAALERVRTCVEEAGVSVRDLGKEELATRRVEGGIAFEAPGSTPTEVVFGSALDHSPLTTTYNARFVTGALGMGHVVVPVSDLDAATDFYGGTLGFHPRGSFSLPLPEGAPAMRIRFLSPNARHHSVAIMPSPSLQPPALVHIMVELETLDEVGQALDRVLSAGYHLSSTLGRHTNDKMVSFYVRTPGGWDLEVGCDGLVVDQDAYLVEEITADSYWGHRWDFSR